MNQSTQTTNPYTGKPLTENELQRLEHDSGYLQSSWISGIERHINLSKVQLETPIVPVTRKVKTAEFITVTPDMAASWLESDNSNNRRKRYWWSHAIATAILRGEWITTHQGIAFSVDGLLLDGQHRLEAIVESNTALEMLVVTGIDANAFKVIDGGIKRTITDTTGLGQRTAQACKQVGRIIYSGDCTSQQALTIYNAGFGEIHDALIEFCPSSKRVYSSCVVRLAACILVLDGRNKNDVFSIYSNLVNERFELLTPITHSFIRQINSGGISTTMLKPLLARSLKCLNSDNADKSRLLLSDTEEDKALVYTRNILLTMMRNKNE